MHWKPAKKTVELAGPARPSRIRREPVQLNPNVPVKPQRPLNYRERELYLGIAGVLIFAALISVGILAFSAFTAFRDDPVADARYAQFTQCYNAQGPNCVLDGGTIYVSGQRIDIAGLVTPRIGDAGCDLEHDRGVAAASQLALLLNSGRVAIGAPFRDRDGRAVRKVEVNGRDDALKLIALDLVREAGGDTNWCRSS